MVAAGLEKVGKTTESRLLRGTGISTLRSVLCFELIGLRLEEICELRLRVPGGLLRAAVWCRGGLLGMTVADWSLAIGLTGLLCLGEMVVSQSDSSLGDS